MIKFTTRYEKTESVSIGYGIGAFLRDLIVKLRTSHRSKNKMPNQTTIIVKSDFDRFDKWSKEFKQYGITTIRWQDLEQDADAIDYALVWQPEPGQLAKLKNLKAIFSVGAGIDHLKPQGTVPDDIPIVRMVEDSLTNGMIEYVLYTVLHFHRDMPRYQRQQQASDWQQNIQQAAWDRSVGIMGLGVLGAAAGKALHRLRFNVNGWSQSQKHIDGITSYHGQDQLEAFLNNSQFLVSLLPHTDATDGLIDKNVFNKLPKDAYFINAGRGPVVNEQDLLNALDTDQLAGAALDVFQQEPLPKDHPLWHHPKVLITPHVASMTLETTSAKHVAENIKRHQAGQAMTHIADLTRGY